MFTVPRVNVIANDEGFSVEILGRTGIEYREGAKSLFVDSEVLAVGKGIAVFANSIRNWSPPYEREGITSDERQRIVRNICRAMEFRNQAIEVL